MKNKLSFMFLPSPLHPSSIICFDLQNRSGLLNVLQLYTSKLTMKGIQRIKFKCKIVCTNSSNEINHDTSIRSEKGIKTVYLGPDYAGRCVQTDPFT